MKFKHIQKFENGGQSKKVEATFGLPEVNIYPQNEFGDIARSQGINKARNWKKVKEGTTKGINDFYNDPRTQIIMAGLPLPSMLDAAGDGIRMAGPIIKNSKVGKAAKEMFGNIKGNVKTYINKNIINNLTEHVQGDEAVKMFKQYGGQDPIIENSPLMDRMRRYAPEARERYGIVGNTNITDEEIARSLYKQANSISQKGNQAINKYGEPLVLFRGDTNRYTNLLDRMSPDELATKSGTMDNSLGNLFLGDLPKQGKGLGIDRYITTQRSGRFTGIFPSGTGSKINISPQTVLADTRPLVTNITKNGEFTVSKVPAKYNESGINDINAFVVNSKGVRNSTDEISVLGDDFISKQKDFKGIPYDESRQSIAQHYNTILKDAEQKEQGLLKSNAGARFREEHERYDYFALPNYNKQNAKHLLPYDMRIPRNFKDPNIYKTIAGGVAIQQLNTNKDKNK